MPKEKGRGKVLRARTVKIGPNQYMKCDVYEKPGPKGGHTVCGKVKTKKKT